MHRYLDRLSNGAWHTHSNCNLTSDPYPILNFDAHHLERNMASFSEQDLELAGVAKDAFDNHRYESCLSALNKLLDSRRRDGRVVHNRAVAQYLLSNLTHTDEFRRTLQSVSAQVLYVCAHTYS